MEKKSSKDKIVLCDFDRFTYPFDEPISVGAKGAILLGFYDNNDENPL